LRELQEKKSETLGQQLRKSVQFNPIARIAAAMQPDDTRSHAGLLVLTGYAATGSA
jgi:hypothetical protein